jgi:glycosyltransferase involved in cell wall biosynthesis
MSNDQNRYPRKVMHVLSDATGGAALSTLGLIESFRARGIAACAVCHDAGSPQEREALREATGGEVLFTNLYWWNKKIRVPLWKRPLIEMRQVLRTGWARRSSSLVAEFGRAHQADLVHTSTIVAPEGGMAARRLGLPHVWHLRELLGPGKPYRLPYEGPSFGRYMAAHCSKLVANSQVTAAQVRSWVSDDLLEVVPNGINIGRFRPKMAPARPGRVVVGMVGNLASRVKKHALLVEAAARVDRSLPIEWRIYGHDPSCGGTIQGDAYVDALHRRLAAASIADRFVWPGHVADPAEIMTQIDILVHPADGESFGRVVVEAMAAALPVVGVRGGGVAEIVDPGVTGLLAQTDDPQDLADCIARLARDAALRDVLGQAGRERAAAHYSLDACAAAMLDVYEKAMHRPLSQSAARTRNAQPAAARGAQKAVASRRETTDSLRRDT